MFVEQLPQPFPAKAGLTALLAGLTDQRGCGRPLIGPAADTLQAGPKPLLHQVGGLLQRLADGVDMLNFAVTDQPEHDRPTGGALLTSALQPIVSGCAARGGNLGTGGLHLHGHALAQARSESEVPKFRDLVPRP